VTERIGIILAGGGEADWPWRPGLSLLDQAERIVQRAGVDTSLICGAHDRPNAVADRGDGIGPLAALHQALDHPSLSLDATLIIIPVDMPALNPRALTRLAEIAEYDGRGALFDLGPLPLALVLTAKLRATLDEVAAGQGSLNALARRLELPIMASLPDDGLDNVGSQQELVALRQRVAGARTGP